MKILFVGGTWNTEGGKPSGLIDTMQSSFVDLFKLTAEKERSSESCWLVSYNGGNYDELEEIISTAVEYDVILWLANVPNDLPKVRDVKKVNPTAIVVGSKRNFKNEYTFVEVLNKSLLQRHNLTIEFYDLEYPCGIKYGMRLFDPLGTLWYEGTDPDALFIALIKRLLFLVTTRREKTYEITDGVNGPIPDYEEFFSYVRDVAETFHKTIEHADGVTRFLGNASFRLGDKLFVSQRDVDKALISKDTFIECLLGDDDKVHYYGKYKPSKDTVVQTRLYKMLPNINHIVHSHCYAKGAPFTSTPVPCGALDEIDEVLEVIEKYYNNDLTRDYYKINLAGHGCLIFGKTVELMKQTQYITRHLPEDIRDGIKKNIIITAGGTSEYIDAVRKITNSSTGKLGARVAEALADKPVNIYYLAPRNAVLPDKEWVNYTHIETTDTKSVKDNLECLLNNKDISYVIHSMAISDYTVGSVFANGEVLDNSRKLSSDYDEMLVKLVKTPKIINLIKKTSPDTKLVGFKLLNKVSEDDLVAAAKKQIVAADSDYVIANDSALISNDKHHALLIDHEGEVVKRMETKAEIADTIVNIILK